MADGISELAMLLKERENKAPVSFAMGTVTSREPLVIAPDGINYSLGADDLIISQRVAEGEEEVEINGEAVTIRYEGLKLYDRVVLLPSTDGQKYFVMDRVVV